MEDVLDLYAEALFTELAGRTMIQLDLSSTDLTLDSLSGMSRSMLN
jgi:hypothetical protein